LFVAPLLVTLALEVNALVLVGWCVAQSSVAT
jgi:hypothetical protein